MPEATIIQQILLGAAGEASGGLIAGLLTAAGARVARRFRSPPRRRALEDAFGEALEAAFETLPQRSKLTDYYLDSLRAWLAQAPVREELVLLLEPTDPLDVDRLRQEFMAITQGTAPERIPDFDFDRFVAALARAFYEAAKGQEELREIIKVERLDDIVTELEVLTDQVSELQASSAATADHTRRTTEVLADIRTTMDELRDIAGTVAAAYWQQYPDLSPAATPGDLQAATARYLAFLLDRYRYLDFRGMGVADRVPLRLPLTEMYVPLKARVQLPEGETWSRDLRMGGRPPGEEEMEAIGQRVGEPQPVLPLIQEQPGLIVLGDPGAGKTTLLKYIAVRLAAGDGEALGLGRRLPILLPLSAYAAALAEKDVPLDAFIDEYYRRQGVKLPLQAMIAEALRRGGALFLLDGLDEVQSLEQRHLVVERVRAFFTFHREQGNKFMLTSRIVGYGEIRPNDGQLTECTLVDFEQEEIEAFIERWVAALERAALGSDSPAAVRAARREKEGLLDAVSRNQGVRRLASNPLLLTILALMKRQGVDLPERRVELYAQYVQVLIRHWNVARSLGGRSGRELDVVETIRVLGALALWIHHTSAGRGLVKQGPLRRELERIYAARGHREPGQAARQLLRDVREHAGLLVARGRRMYGFIHLTFQEYLTAVGIAQLGQSAVRPVVDLLAEHIGDDAWHEVSLLTIGQLGIVQQRDEAAGVVLTRLVGSAPGEPGEALLLAGEAVADVGTGGVTVTCRQVIVAALVEALHDNGVAPARRARAGQLLAQLGDPRPGVCTLEPLLSEPIEAGTIRLRENDEEHSFEAFQVAKYPVTNAQFRVFVEGDGYENEEWWSEEGWNWRQREEWREPRFWDDPRYNRDNQPVVGVSLYEAEAYAAWLSAKTGRAYRLPTEAEWERAAGHTDGREYSWAGEWQEDHANTSEAGLGRPSAVGMFPRGAAHCGALDMSGNVWEWTSSLSREDSTARVFRGGSFSDNRGVARVGSRNFNLPLSRFNLVGFRLVSPVGSGS